MENYSEQDMLSFGNKVLSISNRVLERYTNLTPLTKEQGEEKVKEILEVWKKEIGNG